MPRSRAVNCGTSPAQTRPIRGTAEARDHLKMHELEIEQTVDVLFRWLEWDRILVTTPKVTPKKLPNPNSDELIDLHVPSSQCSAWIAEAKMLPQVLITDVNLNWLQVIGEGWAAPLRGFMREWTLLEMLHLNSILVDPFILTENKGRLERWTDCAWFKMHQPPDRVSMSARTLDEERRGGFEEEVPEASALVVPIGRMDEERPRAVRREGEAA